MFVETPLRARMREKLLARLSTFLIKTNFEETITDLPLSISFEKHGSRDQSFVWHSKGKSLMKAYIFLEENCPKSVTLIICRPI